MGRIDIICSYLDECDSFADIGCDHGYCTQYMLEHNLCKQAIISDISEKSLSKAEGLLRKYMTDGICRSVCSDGLQGISQDVDEVLIAGMGGEEIIKILSQSFIPKKFVFQPMKSVPELRQYLIDNNCRLTKDDIFKDGKYYFIIKGERCGGRQTYTKAQLAFGRDSLKNDLLHSYITEEIDKINNYLQSQMTNESRANLFKKLQFLEGVKRGEIN